MHFCHVNMIRIIWIPIRTQSERVILIIVPFLFQHCQLFLYYIKYSITRVQLYCFMSLVFIIPIARGLFQSIL